MDKSKPTPATSGVTSPKAAAYAQRVGIPKYTAPVGIVPSVPIPLLEGQAAQGATMAEQAKAMRTPPAAAQGSIFTQEPARTDPRIANPFAPGKQMNIWPTDMLTKEAMEDPTWSKGPGAAFAATHPHLVAKYGLNRGGKHIPPQAFTGSGPLRAETQQQLKDIAEFNNQLKKGAVTAEDREVEAQVKAESAAGAAAKLGGAMGINDGGEKKVSTQEPIDKLDLRRIREMATADMLNSEEQRAIIEARCPPITLDEYVINGCVRQRVPINPGVLEPTFQSLTLEDDLTLKRLIFQEARSIETAERYLEDKYGWMGLAAGLYAINGTIFPSHLDQNGVFNEELFWEKFKKVMRLPFHLGASLSINFFWFEVRVRMLCKASKSP